MTHDSQYRDYPVDTRLGCGGWMMVLAVLYVVGVIGFFVVATIYEQTHG